MQWSPLVPKQPQICSKHAAAAVQVPGDLPLVHKQPQSCSKHAAAAVQCTGTWRPSPCSQATHYGV